jgi:condensin complex subunit 1
VLCDQDPLCIVEQQNFDQLCSLVACFERVEGPKRRQLIDSLCSSLTCLNAWIDKLLTAPADPANATEHADSVAQHRSAYKAYIFFLSWISGLAGREAAAAGAAQAAAAATQAAPAASGRGGGRKKKAAADELIAGWDWAAQFPKVVKAVAQALNTDLWALCRPSAPEEAMLIKATQLVGGWLGRWEWMRGGWVGGWVRAGSLGSYDSAAQHGSQLCGHVGMQWCSSQQWKVAISGTARRQIR